LTWWWWAAASLRTCSTLTSACFASKLLLTWLPQALQPWQGQETSCRGARCLRRCLTEATAEAASIGCATRMAWGLTRTLFWRKVACFRAGTGSTCTTCWAWRRATKCSTWATTRTGSFLGQINWAGPKLKQHVGVSSVRLWRTPLGRIAAPSCVPGKLCMRALCCRLSLCFDVACVVCACRLGH
jgi:hypothetical protein